MQLHMLWMEWPEMQALVRAFAEVGAPIRFVGGAVRDSLLSRPIQDVDIATPALPDAVMALLKRANVKAIPTGIDHGTVTAVIGEKHFEITTLRRDVACDGRHAEVEYTDDWRADAARRDFTINALYASAEGELFDYFGGLAHLKPLRILFIGDAKARIEEDALRILRFFRFSAQLGAKEFDAAALKACTEKSSMISSLSGERVRDEMLKLLAASALEAPLLAHMQNAGVLKEIGLPAPPASLAHMPGQDALARLALWLMQGGDAKKLRERWKLSGAQYDVLCDFIRTASKLVPGMSEREQKKLLRAMGREIFRRAARIASALHADQKAFYAQALTMAEQWTIPEFPLRGADLLSHGFAEGKALGEKLKELEAAWEAEDYRPTREELLKRLS